MNDFDRYAEAREAGRERAGIALHDKPFSCYFGYALGGSVVAASVYIVSFADTDDQRWRHFWISLPFVLALGLLFFIFAVLENRGPLPVGFRRIVWMAVLLLYAGAFGVVAFTAFSPLGNRTHAWYTLIKMGPTLPIPLFAWHFLKQSKMANQSTNPTP
jgi:hypothetical protein